jgi:hypothetical protein
MYCSQAIFCETKRPSKEMQHTIAQQLGLDMTTVANFFMNARRRGVERFRDHAHGSYRSGSVASAYQQQQQSATAHATAEYG